jgi:hypothetical protein
MAQWSDFLPDVPYTGAFGTGTPQEEATRAPTPVKRAVDAAGRAAMIPGQVYNSQVPMTSEQMVGPAADLASFVTLGAGAMPADANALRMGIKAYHGSPHDFERFDSSKIGTGEGAQDYGHGLYFAENEGTARAYRDNLAVTPKANSHNWNPDGTPNRAGQVASDLDAAIPEADIRESLRIKDPKASNQQIDDWIANGRALYADAQKSGHMYEVNINAQPSDFLDWDRNLSDQPQAVKDVFNKQMQQFGPDARMRAQMMIAASRHPQGMRGVSADLANAGVPGIQYLDQGSRAAGEGTRNYVVLNDKMIDVLRKYGWAGLAALPAMQGREDKT